MKGKGTHPLVRLAAEAVECRVKDGRCASPPEVLTEEMKAKAGVFVCLKKNGELRGCIGTFAPTRQNVAEETIANAQAAACEDPRFCVVSEDELEGLEYSVDVLSTPEPVKDIKDLDAKRYGVIVQSGARRGLLLPDLPGVDTVGEQLAIAKMKAGIDMTEPVVVYRFEVKRYE